jgi:hypothetical protein
MGENLVMRTLNERVEIKAPAKAVWEVLADFGGVADWAPYMRRRGHPPWHAACLGVPLRRIGDRME